MFQGIVRSTLQVVSSGLSKEASQGIPAEHSKELLEDFSRELSEDLSQEIVIELFRAFKELFKESSKEFIK